MSEPQGTREAPDSAAVEAPDSAAVEAPDIEPELPEPPPGDVVAIVEPVASDGDSGSFSPSGMEASEGEAPENAAVEDAPAEGGVPQPPPLVDAVLTVPLEELEPAADGATAGGVGQVVEPFGEGFLDELPLPAEPDAPAETVRRELELGAYEVVGRDGRGRELAVGPEGQEVVLAVHPGGLEDARALYPHPLLPLLLDSGPAEGGGTIVALERPAGRSLEDALIEGARLDVVRATLDLARLNRYVVARGMALVGLDPRDVLLGPTRLARIPLVRRIGEAAPAEAPRGAAPERAAGLDVAGSEGSFALGALLYRSLVGRELAEGELPVELGGVPGAPQALGSLLAPAGARASAGEALELMTRLERTLRPRPHLEVAAATTVGINQDRPTNEDSCGWSAREGLFDAGPEGLLVACVADGMGGMAGGEVASRAAVASFLEPGSAAFASRDALAARVAAANARVLEALEGQSGGCTFTGVVAHGPQVAVGHVGDTRAYRVAAGEVLQLTEDHSVVAMLVKMGMIEPEAAHGHPDSNKVTRALGSVREFPADYVQTLELRLEPGDRLVLLSDGVWGPFLPALLDERLRAGGSIRELADGLVNEALRLGSSDNATALVIEYLELEPLG